MKDQRTTTREVTTETGIRIGFAHTISTDNLGLKRVAVEFVPKLLTMDQKPTDF